MLMVTYFFREKRQFGYSIEGIFQLMKLCLRDKVVISDFHSDVKFSRLVNIFKARKFSNNINHVTGDVYYLAIGFQGRNNILTIHDLGHYDHLKKNNRIKFFIYHFFWLYFPLKRAKIVTVVSSYTGQHLIENFNFVKDKLRIVYNPVKPVFQFDKKNNLHDIPVILQIGTGPHKNLRNLIEACRDINVHLNIVASIDASLLQLLMEYNISFTQFQNISEQELFEQYKNCDLLFFASFTEGFGMPIIEAQAVGRPVITSNFGAMKEIAADSALLVDPHSPQEIQNAISVLISNSKLYNELVDNGIENIKRFNKDKIAKDYFDIYKELYNSSVNKSS